MRHRGEKGKKRGEGKKKKNKKEESSRGIDTEMCNKPVDRGSTDRVSSLFEDDLRISRYVERDSTLLMPRLTLNSLHLLTHVEYRYFLISIL